MILATRAQRTVMPSIFFKMQDAATKFMFGSDTGTSKNAFYDLVDHDMKGNEVKMDKFKGDVLCIVNVASKWGLTKTNYVQFSELADKYSLRGFRILAFPCNQFGGQEPVSLIEVTNLSWHIFMPSLNPLLHNEKRDLKRGLMMRFLSLWSQNLVPKTNSPGLKRVTWMGKTRGRCILSWKRHCPARITQLIFVGTSPNFWWIMKVHRSSDLDPKRIQLIWLMILTSCWRRETLCRRRNRVFNLPKRNILGAFHLWNSIQKHEKESRNDGAWLLHPIA